jgi:hypothetical protein
MVGIGEVALAVGQERSESGTLNRQSSRLGISGHLPYEITLYDASITSGPCSPFSGSG